MHKISLIIGFIILGLSPSLIDWQQSPELRYQFLAYYGIAILLIYAGLDGIATQ